MKLQKLTIQNIASIENATIDFCSGPLATEPLFLISGETGSGKTTLLDCISLALYKETPRLGKKSTGDVDNIGINDCRQLLRRGSTEGYTKLDFIGNDDLHYHARWAARRARGKIDGNIIATWTLGCDETKMELTKDNDISPQIEAAVGLTFPQFSRTTMLAQGEFTQFLKSEGDEKALLLEKLTGTEIFSRIGMKIFELNKTAEEAYSRKKESIAAYQLLSKEDREKLETLVDTKKNELNKVKQEKEQLDLQKTWMETEQKLNTQHEKLKKIHTDAQSLLMSDQTKQQQQLVNEWALTTEVRQQMELLAKAQATAEQQKKDIALQQVQFVQLTQGIKYIELKLKEFDNRHTELSNILKTEENNKAMYGAAELIANHIDQYKKKIAEIELKTNELTRIKKEIEETKKSQATATIEWKTAREEVQTAQKEVEQLRAIAGTLDIGKLNQKVDTDSSRINDLKKVSEILALQQQQQQQYDETKNRIQEGSEQQKNLNTAKETAHKALTTAKESLLACEQRYAGAKDMGEETLKLLRSKLQLGTPCPLCGQRITELHSNEELDAIYQKYTAAIAHANTEIARCQDAFTAATNAAGKHEGFMKQLANTKDLQEKVLADTKSALTSACSKVEIDSQTPELEQQLATEMEQADKQKAIDVEARDKANLNSQQLAKAQDEQIKKDTAAQKKKGHLDILENSLSKASINGTNITTLIRNLHDEANKTLSDIKKLLSADTLLNETDLESFKTTLLQKAADFKQNDKSYNDLVVSIDRGKDLVKNLNEPYNNLQKIFNWPIPTTATPLQMKDIASQQSRLLLNASALKANCTTTLQAIKEYTKTIDSFCTENNMPKEYIANLMSHANNTYVKSIANTLEQAHKNLNESQGSLDTNTHEIKEHLKMRPTELLAETTPELLQTSLNTLNEQIEILNQEIGNTTGTLETNNERYQQVQKEQSELQSLETIRNNWNRLNTIFGDAKGKTFRDIAESFVLQTMLVAANAHLSRFTNRYQLSCRPGSMVLEMIDKDMGRSVRPVNTLSGGESFIVSLALALALSNLNQNKNSVDTLFIDEGFGTLSEEILDVVVSSLEALHQNGGHRVGIISHMSKLSERIHAQIQVKSINGNRSSVTIVGN